MDPRTLRDERLSVYGDSLLAEGKQQGSLIHLQLARHRAPFARRALAQKQSEQELIAAHREEFFGPLAGNSTLRAAWSLGFISNFSITLGDDLEALEEALALPTFARLERLSLRGAFGDLSFLARTKLHHLVLDGESDLDELLPTLPPIRSLTLRGDASVDFGELTLEGTEVLRLAVGFEGLTTKSAPKLRVLSVTEVPEEFVLPSTMRLLHLDGAYYGELPELDVPRIIHESEWGDPAEDDRVLTRCGNGRYGERALLITSAHERECRAAIERFDAKNLSAAVSAFEFACHAFTAIELRMENATDGALLRQTSEALAKGGHRAIEFATSASNHECLAWSIEPSRVRPLAMGPAKERSALWQLAIDRGFGFDPGDSLDDLLLELDGSEHVVLGDDPGRAIEWPLVTTFTPREPDWNWDYDQEDEVPPGAGETNFDPLDFRDQSQPTNWWKTENGEETTEPVAPVEESEDGAEPDEEPIADATSEDWDEVLNESPVDLESDGAERNPEYGLEPDFFDPDSVPSGAHLDGETDDPVQCVSCEARTITLRVCRGCSRKFCAQCIEVPAGADGEVLCRDCPPPRPAKAPEPIDYTEDEEEEEEEEE